MTLFIADNSNHIPESLTDLMIPSYPLYYPLITFFFIPTRPIYSLILLPDSSYHHSLPSYLLNLVYLSIFTFSPDYNK